MQAVASITFVKYDELTGEQQELALLAENDTNWNQVGKVLTKFYKRSELDNSRAIQYIDDVLLRQVAKQQCATWRVIWPRRERLLVASYILGGFIAEFQLGNFWEI